MRESEWEAEGLDERGEEDGFPEGVEGGGIQWEAGESKR